MKLTRTTNYHFGWLGIVPLIDVVFLLLFFFLLSSTFVLQPGISVSLPFSRFTLGRRDVDAAGHGRQAIWPSWADVRPYFIAC